MGIAGYGSRRIVEKRSRLQRVFVVSQFSFNQIHLIITLLLFYYYRTRMEFSGGVGGGGGKLDED